jgi:hypothetical protein
MSYGWCRCGRDGFWSGESWNHDCAFRYEKPRQRKEPQQQRDESSDAGSSAETGTPGSSGGLGCIVLLVVIGFIWGADGFVYLLKVPIALLLMAFHALTG